MLKSIESDVLCVVGIDDPATKVEKDVDNLGGEWFYDPKGSSRACLRKTSKTTRKIQYSSLKLSLALYNIKLICFYENPITVIFYSFHSTLLSICFVAVFQHSVMPFRPKREMKTLCYTNPLSYQSIFNPLQRVWHKHVPAFAELKVTS